MRAPLRWVWLGSLAACAIACATFGNGSDAAGGDADAGGDAASSSDGGDGADAPTDAPPGSDGDGNDAGLCAGDAACQRVVFVTSQRYVPASGFVGVTGANTQCNELASSAAAVKVVHDKSFVAWLSDASSFPAATLPKSGVEYVRVDGVRVAASFAALTSGTLEHPIDIDETGTVLPTGAVWTGTTSAGLSDTANCSGWANANAVSGGTVGLPGSTNSAWTQGAPVACNSMQHLYCLEL